MGFNILLYGLGSKKLLLEKFRTEMLSDSMHLVVNGFFPSITLKTVSLSFYYTTLSFQKEILSKVIFSLFWKMAHIKVLEFPLW